MTTLIVNIKNSRDARKIADALRLMDSVTNITVEDEDKKSFQQAAEECNAVTVDVFFDKLDAQIKKWDHAESLG